MRTETPQTIHLNDYAPVPYRIVHADLDISLDPSHTVVRSRLQIEPRTPGAEMVLQGEAIKLNAIAINGQVLPPEAYVVGADRLHILSPPGQPFVLEITQTCNPSANTQLSGLYLSNGIYCTQMEAEGFRRFAYFYDRPDVMATYTVRLEAPASLPVLLSNGNPKDAGAVPGTDRHYAIWDDPHPKPTYLFALVGGDLASVHDTFTTMGGRTVRLGIYVEKGKEERCAWAMESLKASMRWDETRFGREYDLDVFNIVAVSDFNMGAMENKGLNIFNDKYVLALPETATDTDYINIEAIIAHEYFHNWSGNRVTCRDWFQLCLKEGLTVFRDQEFTSDIRSRPVKRIADVKTLRARQLPEDQGPLSHPVRPSSYIEINNFYTPTVYEKGAEICRMLHTLIGETSFRKSMDLYFQRHDGEAATVEDFVACMAEASGRDLTQFFRWYEQAGTPTVTVATNYDAGKQTFTVALKQETAPTPGQPDKKPLHMPLGIGLVAPDGADMALNLEGRGALNTPVIELTQPEQSFTFTGVRQRPVLSINRGFSAPIALNAGLSEQDLLFLAGRDSDTFNRWEAAQTVGRALIMRAIANGGRATGIEAFAVVLRDALTSPSLDDAFKAAMLGLPPEAEIAASLGGEADSDLVCAARDDVRRRIGQHLSAELRQTYEATKETELYHPDPKGTARRTLHNTALSLIAAHDGETALGLANAALANPANMTNELGALNAILSVASEARDGLIAAFYERHRDDHLLVDKWFMLNAHIPGPDAHLRITTLMQHKDFKLTTPNRVYALVSGFAGGNLSGFNAAHGEGYRLVADAVIALDPINPQVASRVATGFRSWKLFNAERRDKAKIHMERILSTPALSRDVFEIISRTLA